MADPTRLWDKIAEKYARQPIKDIASYEQTMARTRAHLSKTDEILEIGSGTGSTAVLLSDDVKHVTASDFSAGMIDIGKRRAHDANVENITFVQSTVFGETLKDAGYDAVLAYNFLYLLEEPEAAFKRIHTLLKPGGLFISKSMCLGEKTVLIRALIWVMRQFGRAPFVNFFKIQQLNDLMTEAGLEIIESGEIPKGSATRFIVARKV